MKGTKLKKFLIISLLIHISVLLLLTVYMVPSGSSSHKRGIVSVGLINVKNDNRSQATGTSAKKSRPARNRNRNRSETRGEKYLTEKSKNLLKKSELEISQKNTPKKSIPQNYREKENVQVARENNETHSSDMPEKNTNSDIRNSGTVGTSDERVAGYSGTNTNSGSEDALTTHILAHPDYNMNPGPRYPIIARRRGYEGTVKLRVLVLKSGKVGKMEIEKPSGYSILDNAAMEAVQKWTFIPGRKDGIPVTSWVTVPVKFRLTSG